MAPLQLVDVTGNRGYLERYAKRTSRCNITPKLEFDRGGARWRGMEGSQAGASSSSGMQVTGAEMEASSSKAAESHPVSRLPPQYFQPPDACATRGSNPRRADSARDDRGPTRHRAPVHPDRSAAYTLEPRL